MRTNQPTNQPHVLSLLALALALSPASKGIGIRSVIRLVVRHADLSVRLINYPVPTQTSQGLRGDTRPGTGSMGRLG